MYEFDLLNRIVCKYVKAMSLYTVNLHTNISVLTYFLHCHKFQRLPSLTMVLHFTTLFCFLFQIDAHEAETARDAVVLDVSHPRRELVRRL